MGPWRAAERFVRELLQESVLSRVRRVQVNLFGSLAKTGVGHGTDLALFMGLSGHDPVTVDPPTVRRAQAEFRSVAQLTLAGRHTIAFEYTRDIHFVVERSLEYHPNGITFVAELEPANRHADTDSAAELAAGIHDTLSRTYFSIGGGFVVEEDEGRRTDALVKLPYPIDEAADILRWTAYNREHKAERPDTEHDSPLAISDIVWANERIWDPNDRVEL